MRQSSRLFGCMIVVVALSIGCHSKTFKPATDFNKRNRLTFGVTIDYNRSLEGMIEAGKYNLVVASVKDHYSVSGNGLWGRTIELDCFGRFMTTDEVLQEFDQRGLWHGRIQDLLALGIDHPDMQRKYPIVAIGSSWTSGGTISMVPYLYGNDHERFLSEIESMPNLAWSENTCFIASPK